MAKFRGERERVKREHALLFSLIDATCALIVNRPALAKYFWLCFYYFSRFDFIYLFYISAISCQTSLNCTQREIVKVVGKKANKETNNKKFICDFTYVVYALVAIK